MAVPCPPVTFTLATPVPGVAVQLKMLPSSVPERLTVNGGGSCATVVIGFAGGGDDRRVVAAGAR